MSDMFSPSRWIVRFMILSVVLSAGWTVQAQNRRNVERANKLVTEGARLFDKKDYKGAVKKYDEAIKLVPTFPLAHHWKGMSHFFLKQYQPALVSFNTALSQGHDEFEVKSMRYRANYLLGNIDAALSDGLEAMSLDKSGAVTGDATVYLVLGEIYLRKQNYAEANKFYKKCAEIAPDTKEIFYFVAVTHSQLGDKVEAGLAAIEAMNKGTEYVADMSILAGDYLLGVRRLDEAARYYEKVLELKPDRRDLYLLVADIYRLENRFEPAIALLLRAQKRFPNDAGIFVDLSWNYSFAKRNEEAAAAATRAIEISPNEPAAYTNRCRAYYELKRLDLAIQSCNEALRLLPGDGETHYYLGRSQDDLNQEQRARTNYIRAVEGLGRFVRNNPNSADGFYLLASAQYMLMRYDEALDNYRKCLSLAPRYARAKVSLGVTYLIKKNRAKAMEQYRELLEIDPDLAALLKEEIDRP